MALAREGVHIAALDVAKSLAYPGYELGTPHDLDSLVDECRAFGVSCLVFAADVRDDVAVNKAIEETVRRFSQIDVLFNNAGICGYGLARTDRTRVGRDDRH